MKQILTVAAVMLALTSCDSETTATSTTNADSAALTAPADNTMVASTTYTAAEGDVMMKDGSLMIWRNGNWAKADTDVTLDNGVVVTRAGVVKRDTVTVNLNEGESLTRTGNFFDRTGSMIEDGWDATKKGVRKAGEAVGKGAEKAWDATKKGAQKVGEAAESVVD